MGLEPGNRYADHFRSLLETHGTLPPATFQALLADQIEAIRAQLVAANYGADAIDAELRMARAAAASVGGVLAEQATGTPEEKKVTEVTKSEAAEARAGGGAKKFALFIVAALLAVAYAAVILLFLREGHPKLALTGVPGDATPIEAHFIGIDLVKETATMTITPNMASPLVAARGKLITDVTVEIESGVSTLSHTFKRGDVAVPWVAVIPLEYGDQLEYPFDKHGGDFEMKVTRGNAEGKASNLEIDKITHGFSMSASGAMVDDGSQLNVEFEITRSPAVLFLALIAMVSLTLTVFAAVAVAYQVAFNGKKTEFSMMTWMAALLFVVPSVRNGLPGGPPHGAFVDIALFFWLHVLSVLALLTVVWCWNKQK